VVLEPYQFVTDIGVPWEERQYFEPKIKVICKNCDRVYEEDVKFIDIEEDMQGRNLLTFDCHICGERNRSYRLG